MGAIEVRSKEELKQAQAEGWQEIIVLGHMAQQIYQARVLKTMSKGMITALVGTAGISALTSVPTGGLSLGVASLAVPFAGVSTETLLLLAALGSVLIAIVREYDMEYDLKRNRLILRKGR